MKFIDQMNNTILLSDTPKRIVSLVPSITELLVDLGLENNLIGITKFCVEPSYLKSKIQIIGGTKNLNIDKIQKLAPDFIIANKEENIESDILELKKFTIVWVSDVKTIDDNFDLINQLGYIFDKKKESVNIINSTKSIFNKVLNFNNKNKKVLYLIWNNPYMSIGRDTFIHNILTQFGFENSIQNDRYPIVELENFKDIDIVFLSTEPYPFSEKDIFEIQNQLPKSQIKIVDGTYFSWYGSRISKSSDYFEQLITNLD